MKDEIRVAAIKTFMGGNDEHKKVKGVYKNVVATMRP